MIENIFMFFVVCNSNLCHRCWISLYVIGMVEKINHTRTYRVKKLFTNKLLVSINQNAWLHSKIVIFRINVHVGTMVLRDIILIALQMYSATWCVNTTLQQLFTFSSDAWNLWPNHSTQKVQSKFLSFGFCCRFFC